MSELIWNLLNFVIAIGLLVTVHEFGHFWVARKNGVFVKRFSIGFGKALVKWHDKQGTEYVIAILPLGGYVQMLDARVDPILPEQQHLTFTSKTVWQRMAIIAAGPMANFIFALLVLSAMYVVGVPNIRPVIGEVTPHSIAALANVPAKSQIIALNGEPAEDWRAVSLLLVEQVGSHSVSLSVRTEQGSEHTLTLDLSRWRFDPDKESVFGSLGLQPLRPEIVSKISAIESGSAAQLAGLQLGDEIVALNDEPIQNWQALVNRVQNSANESLRLQVNRAGEQLRLEVTPQSRLIENGLHQGYLGVTPTVLPWPDDLLFTQHYGPLEAIGVGFEKTGQLIRLTFSMLAKFVVGDISVKHLSGPISIAQGAGSSADLGFIAFLSFLALISVNLGVINLLPLPILDGGHLMYLVVELIRGKPVSERVQEVGYRVGSLFLLALMGIALFNDISRL